MNKTVNINLAGTFFHIDEDAYSKLQRYLEAIKRSFTDPQGRSEIISDIEARISELFTERIKDEKQVISITEVEDVITVMGQPEDYIVDEEIFEDEPQPRERKSSSRKLYRDTENAYIIVATTRPETMLGDTAVAVHPEDQRYTSLIGRHVNLPLVGRRVPIIADEYSDPEKGTGAVKITPAHDFNDFEVGRRHGLEAVNVLDQHGSINDNAPEAYRGLDRYEARKRVVADLNALGLLDKVEDHAHVVPYGDRSGTVIEPWLTDQWYVDAATLAKPAIAAVEDGRTRFVPKAWENTYFEWMRNIQPWCISRQLWWGHRIPAWYGRTGI